MDGSNYRIVWNPVKTADGYQVCKCFWNDEFGWGQHKINTKNFSAGIEWPNMAWKLKVKVRAYRVAANGKKIYGAWSKKVTIKSKLNGKVPFEKVTKVK